MTFRCVDLETTGLPDEVPGEPTGIMEAGWCDMKNFIIKPPQSVLVDCGIPVRVGARAVHHISDEMVAGEIRPDQATTMLATGDHEYVVAHNTDHEKLYIGPGINSHSEGGEERKWICTFKTSLRIWPEAPGHKLWELCYFLKLDEAEDFDIKLAWPPHRAPADAYVCAHLLRKLLQQEKVTVEQLVRWSSGPALLYMCWLKKHRGTPWKDVPKDYLRWVVENIHDDRDVRATAKYYLTRPQT